MSAWLRPVLVVPVLLGAGFGMAGGWLWWRWWGPPPDGKIYELRDGGLQWYPDPFDPGLTRDFSGTATYVVIAIGLALLLGVLAGIVCRRVAVAGLVVLLVGTAVAAAAMAVYGTSFSPADPMTLIKSHKVGDSLPGHLHVAGWTPYLIWPVGGLIGYFVVMLCLPWQHLQPAGPAGPAGPGDPADPAGPVSLAKSVR